MPSHEGRLSQALEETLGEDPLYDVSKMPEIGYDKVRIIRRSSKIHDDNGLIDSDNSNFRTSAPSRNEHEKFLRDFFEIVLEEAVFEVSVKYHFIHDSATVFRFFFLIFFNRAFLHSLLHDRYAIFLEGRSLVVNDARHTLVEDIVENPNDYSSAVTVVSRVIPVEKLVFLSLSSRPVRDRNVYTVKKNRIQFNAPVLEVFMHRMTFKFNLVTYNC